MSTASLRVNEIKFPDGANTVHAYDVTAPEYGADRTGVADSTAAIQAAITACPAGGTVHIPNGIYLISGVGTELLLVNKAISIVGASRAGALLSIASTVPNTTDIFHVTSPTGVNLGLKFSDFGISPVNGAAKTVSAATNATPIAITTSTNHGYSTGNVVTVAGVLGNTNANGTYVITVTGATTFTLTGSVGNAAYTSGGTAVSVPGRHGFNFDVTSGNAIQNAKCVDCNIFQLGGRAINVTNTAPIQNGFFCVEIRDNYLKGGVNLSKAGDSILIKGNTITGGWNAIDVDLVQNGTVLGGGAHLLNIEDNNVTSQGAFVKVANGSQIRIGRNNVEPGSTGTYGPDNSNNANNAVIDLDGNGTTPIVGAIIEGNELANWSNWGTTGDIVRVNHAQGAIIRENEALRAAAGPFCYKILSPALGTQLSVPVTSDGGTPASLISDASTTTITRFITQAGVEQFGTSANQSYQMAITGGAAQAQPIIVIQTSGGTTILKVSNAGDLLLGGAADNGFPVQLGITQATGRVEFIGGVILNRTAVSDANYTATQADNFIAYTALTAGRTVTLPTGVRAGTVIVVKNESAGAFAITIAPSSGTIDGAASVATTAVARAPAVRAYFNGTNWFTF
jgi:hypothetical protein